MRPAQAIPSSFLVLLVAGLVLGSTPAGAQDGAPASDAPAAGTTLYMHVFGVQDMPMTPQLPDDGYAADSVVGAGTSSLSCFPEAPGFGVTQDYHTFYGYSSPSPVEYGRGGDPDFHPDRGLLGEVSLEGAAPVLHWYWSTQAATADGLGLAPVPVANVVVQATLRAGDDLSVDDTAYNAGDLLAEGRSSPATLAGPQTTGAEHEAIGDRHVYHFEVPLTVAAAAIPADGYNLRVDTYVLRDECPEDGYLTPNVLALHSSLGHRPRLEVAVVEQPSVVPLAPRVENGTWTFDVRAGSDWGGVDIAGVEAEIVGPSAPETLEVEPFHAGLHCHCDFFGANPGRSHDVRITWDAAGEGAEPGEYVLRLRATNLQGNAEAVAEVPFTVAGERESAGVAPLFAGTLLAALALVARRRAS